MQVYDISTCQTGRISLEHSAGLSKLAFWSDTFTYVTQNCQIMYVSLHEMEVSQCMNNGLTSFSRDFQISMLYYIIHEMSDLFLLKSKSNRNALRCAVISLNDLSLIVSLNHLSGLSGEQYFDRPKHGEDNCPEAIFRVMHPECAAWLIYENHLTGTSAAQKWSFHERSDHPYQFLKPGLLTLTWLMEVMRRPW